MDFQHAVNEVWNFFREGFNHVNAVEGLVIALVASFLVPVWHRIWAVALGATLVNLIVDALIPVIAYHQSFRLPPIMDPGYWRFALVLWVGYIIVIGVFFFIKRLFIREE